VSAYVCSPSTGAPPQISPSSSALREEDHQQLPAAVDPALASSPASWAG
jgi:hypothetical protein